MSGQGAQTSDEGLWALWRRLVAEFRLGRTILHLARSRSGWGFYGVDVVSTLRDTPMARGAMTLLAGISTQDLDRLTAIAALNARRNEAIWRMAALFYVSVPVTAFLAVSQAAPGFLRPADPADLVLYVVVGGTAVVALVGTLLYYFTNQWRARQIEAVIDLIRLEHPGEPASSPPSTQGRTRQRAAAKARST